MPEGLDPIETGKKLHEHGEAAERAEKEGGHGEVRRPSFPDRADLRGGAACARHRDGGLGGLLGGEVGHGIARRHRPVLDPGQSRHP